MNISDVIHTLQNCLAAEPLPPFQTRDDVKSNEPSNTAESSQQLTDEAAIEIAQNALNMHHRNSKKTLTI